VTVNQRTFSMLSWEGVVWAADTGWASIKTVIMVPDSFIQCHPQNPIQWNWLSCRGGRSDGMIGSVLSVITIVTHNLLLRSIVTEGVWQTRERNHREFTSIIRSSLLKSRLTSFPQLQSRIWQRTAQSQTLGSDRQQLFIRTVNIHLNHMT
jgi:hypothetical protein